MKPPELTFPIRRSWPRRTITTAAVVAACLVSAVLVAPAPAAADVNQIALTVVSDGRAPFDALDSGPGNGRVRTKDVLTYGWTYSSDTAGPGTVTFVQTLTAPALIRFDPSNLAQCTGPGGGSLSSDGQRLTCAVAVDATGAGTVPITVTVDGSVPNGTIIDASLTANGGALNGGTRTTTVAALPQLNLQANLFGTPTPASIGGASGSGFAFSFVVTVPADAKGTELVTGPLTFTTDLNAISPNAALVTGSCAPVSNGGYAVPYGRIGIVANATAANSVVNTGTVACTQTGRTVTVTITDADLAGRSSPTTGAQGNTLSAALTYLASGTFTVFVPSGDSTSTIQSTIQYRGFDPTSVTGQSNFGSGYEPGGDPAAATCTYVEANGTRANDNCFSTIFGPRSAGYNGYFWTTDTPGGLPAGGATNGSAGDGVASPGQTYYDRLHIYSTSGPALVGAAICDKWNPAETRIVGVGRAYRNNTVVAPSEYTVEYGVLNLPDDNARRTTSCATGTWYGSIEAAGGSAVVNAVRFTASWAIANGETDYFHPQFQVQPNPPGTIIANFDSARLGGAETWGPSYYNRVTNNPSYTGNRLTVTDGVLRVTQSNGLPANGQFIAAGGTVTYTLTPTVTRSTAATSPVGGVTITDTLPACMTYVAGSARYVSGTAPLGVELTAAQHGPDGIPCTGDAGETGPRLLLKLGSITPNATISPIAFQATAVRIAQDNTSAVNTAVISSDAAVAIDLGRRTAGTTITIRNQTQFALSESTSTPQVTAGDPINLTLAYRNVTGLTVPSVVLLSELPYNGDGRSAFTGTLTYGGSSAPSGVVVQCTNRPHGTITPDPGDYTSTCGADTTALRIVITNLANAAVNAVRVTLTPAGNATGDRYVNTSTGSYTPSGSTTPVALPTTEVTQITVVSSTISGRTWNDVSADGIRQPDEPAVAGFPVALSGTNDLGTPVSRTTTTAADGTYAFAGLRAGSYTVTFSPAALRPDQRFSPRRQGTNSALDSDSDPTTGSTGTLTLGTGATLGDVDQGIRLLPPAVTITEARAGSGSAVLTWTPPDYLGSPILSYAVTPYVNGVAQTARTFDGPATTRTVTGLTPGTTYTFTVTPTNAVGAGPASAPSTPVRVNAPPQLSNPPLPAGTEQTPYRVQLTVVDGTAPYAWTTSAGTLPPGLTLDGATGLLAGTPSTPGGYGLTVRVTDASGLSASQALTVQIDELAGLSVSVPERASLGTVTADAGTVTGQLGAVTVTDERGPASGTWTATVTVTDFTATSGGTAGSIPRDLVTYLSGPAVRATGDGTFVPQPGADLAAPRTAARWTGQGTNSVSWNPTLRLTLPPDIVTGNHGAVVTHSVF
ncbi:SdrD B-like domain-containing protein [Micromonospora sp. NPDC049366]|uniref:SdrD B-like domain-containing protein n=1 Tax=Micromonospora sp. NPDC049366 TaxID=3364271 RepID=UPI0037AE2096